MTKKKNEKKVVKEPIISFGDRLYRLISQSRSLLFVQGETAQLTYQAFVSYVSEIEKNDLDVITIKYPLGYRADNTTIEGTATYTKQDLIERYNFLGNTQLPINSVYQMVTVMESLLGSIIREILLAYPN